MRNPENPEKRQSCPLAYLLPLLLSLSILWPSFLPFFFPSQSALMFKRSARFRITPFLAHFRASPLSAPIFTFVGFLTWLPVLSFVHSHIATLMFVTGPSMYPLLNTDYYRTTRSDWVLVDMRNPSKGVKRGMVVSFR